MSTCTQLGKQKGISRKHNFIHMIHKILSDTDTSEVTEVLSTVLDREDAFQNYCLTLGFQACIECGGISSIIPVKWLYSKWGSYKQLSQLIKLTGIFYM